jgi:hypothetical protein
MWRSLLAARGFTTRDVPLGAVIGTVRLIGVRRAEDVYPQIDEVERNLGDYTMGRFAWMFSDPRTLPVSIQFKGRQAILWEAPPELEARVRQSLR